MARSFGEWVSGSTHGATEINKKLTGMRSITIVEMTPERKDMANAVEEIRT